MRVGPARVYWTPWWGVDHHVYGCPIEVIVHTRRWMLMVRPFSDFAQGGDRRGEVEWSRTRQGPSPWEREQVARWVLCDQRPEIWDRLDDRCRCRFCVWCLHDEDLCRASGCRKVNGVRLPEWYGRRFVFVRHVWAWHVVRRFPCRMRPRDMREVGIDD